MAKEFIHGKTVGHMKDSSEMTRNMDTELTHGQMGINTLVNGKVISNTEEEELCRPKALEEMGSGLKERDNIGLMNSPEK